MEEEFVILTAIPYLKIVIYIGVILLGSGAVWTLGREAWRQRKAPV